MTHAAERTLELMAYVDGELDADGVAEVERLLAEDSAARADVDMFRASAMLLRAACGEAHYAARSARVAMVAPPNRLSRRRAGAALAAGIVLAACGFGVGLLWPDRAESGLLAEIAEYHAAISRETTHLAELSAEQGGEFARWMGERLARPLSIPDLRAAGLRFAGGRMLVIDGKPVADFLYTRDHGAPVAVCVARGPPAASPLRIVERGALRLATWGQDGSSFVVVGELDPAAARRIAHLVEPRV